MMLLGVGIVYSKKNSAEELLKRGIILLIGGYIFNIFREGICISSCSVYVERNAQTNWPVRDFFFSFSSLGCTCGIWKFPGQGSRLIG